MFQTDYEDKSLSELITQFKKNQIFLVNMREIITKLDGEKLKEAHEELNVFVEDQLALSYEFMKRHL